MVMTDQPALPGGMSEPLPSELSMPLRYEEKLRYDYRGMKNCVVAYLIILVNLEQAAKGSS